MRSRPTNSFLNVFIRWVSLFSLLLFKSSTDQVLVDRKYRDEIRLRFGLMRAREFVMKDLYTFDATHEKALETYELVRSAYDTIFRRIGLEYRVVRSWISSSFWKDRRHSFIFEL